MDPVTAVIGAAAAMGLFSLIRTTVAMIRDRRRENRVIDKAIAPNSRCRHEPQYIVPVRNEAFGLVASLCTNCFEQLGPEEWAKKADRELAELDAPPVAAPADPKPMVLREVDFNKPFSQPWSSYRRDGYRFVSAENVEGDAVWMTIQGRKHGCVVELGFPNRSRYDAFMAGRDGRGYLQAINHGKRCPLYQKAKKSKLKAAEVYVPVKPSFQAAVMEFGNTIRSEQERIRQTFGIPQTSVSSSGQIGNMGLRFQEMAQHLGIPYDPYESAASFAQRCREAMAERG